MGSQGFSMAATEPLRRRKVVLVGDGLTGKTSLMYRLLHQEEPLPMFTPTIIENSVVKQDVKGELIELMVWDTAGQEEYAKLRPLAYPNTDVVLILCTVENPETLQSIRDSWIREVGHYCPRSKKVLVVNKWDLRDQAQTRISDEDITAAVADLRMNAVFRVSAKTGENIQKLFKKVGELSLERSQRRGMCSVL